VNELAVRVNIPTLQMNIPKPVIIYDKRRVITAGARRSSFWVVASNLAYFLKKYHDMEFSVIDSYDIATSIAITDLWWAVKQRHLSFPPPRVVHWVDTAWKEYRVPTPPINFETLFIATSPWNQKLLKQEGIDSYLLPRAINDEYAEKYLNKSNERKYDFAVVGTTSDPKYHDKKHVVTAYKVLKDMGEYEKSIFVCMFDFCHHKSFDLTNEQVFEILSQSKWFIWLTTSEGFGLPPVEAMSVGTPVIYNDSEYVRFPVVHELNIPVEPLTYYDKADPFMLQNRNEVAIFPYCDYNLQEVKAKFKEALKTEITEEDRIKLHEHVMQNFSHKVILPKLIEITKNYRGYL